MTNATAGLNSNLNWYALHTRSRHEKRIAERLGAEELETFLPVHHTKHVWRKGVHAEVDFPMSPCYLFARASSKNRVRLLQQPEVLGFATSTSRSTIISNDEISVLRVAINSLDAEPHPHLRCGDEVRIVAGPLAGTEGILTRRKQQYRVVLSIEAIMRSIVVEVSEFEIEPKGDKR